MESSCTIKNDTDFNVWITHGGNWNGLLDSIAAASAKATTTAGTEEIDQAVATDGCEEEGQEGPPAAKRKRHAPNVMGGSMSRLEIIQQFAASALAETFGLSQEEAETLKSEVTSFVSAAEKKGPGEIYKWRSTYPKTLRIVYILKDTLQCDGRGCNTGFFTNIDYNISEHFVFQKLDPE